MNYFKAVKIWNSRRGETLYCTPKKGTPEYEEVKKIMNGEEKKEVKKEDKITLKQKIKKISKYIDDRPKNKKKYVKNLIVRKTYSVTSSTTAGGYPDGSHIILSVVDEDEYDKSPYLLLDYYGIVGRFSIDMNEKEPDIYYSLTDDDIKKIINKYFTYDNIKIVFRPTEVGSIAKTGQMIEFSGKSVRR